MNKWLACILLLLSSQVLADEPAQVNIEAWIEPNQAIVVGQQVRLIIELKTDKWFNGGTEIELPTMARAFVLQRGSMAVNGSEKIDGNNWATQRWELVVYPQATGGFTVPRINVSVQVASTARQGQRIVLNTQPMTFVVGLPENIEQDVAWMPASAATLKQQFNIESGQALKVGDAIVREVLVEATDTTAMLLPALVADSIPGSRLYTAPSRVEDRQSRGQYAAMRGEQWTYIIEQAGELKLPAINIDWWDTDSQQMVRLSLEQQRWQVNHTPASFIAYWWLPLTAGLFAIVLLAAALFFIRRHYQHHPLPDAVLFHRMLRQQRWPQAMLLLYRRLFKRQQQLQLKAVAATHPATEALYQQYYGRQRQQPPSKAQLRRLWRAIHPLARKRWWQLPKAIPALTPQGQKTRPVHPKN
ncbi:hypothetical protein SIN8267_02696 [Sinobacterium norvegicum]|uniref:Protein BatD n=1 Tax=Sinobacterium norvegicum TaxID=1641715 RepID=A0ABN8EJE1_9GAMM|nr:BatD family protein [Sinobacterium norvegicum]CAH0992563.1 hypothetical protein SIN8267_02696 [Sinobacterium norvegicum]